MNESQKKKLDDIMERQKVLVDKADRVKEGLIPDDEVSDWYNLVYKLKLALVSHNRKDEDQALRDLARAMKVGKDLLKKMDARKKDPNYQKGLEKSRRRDKNERI